MRSPSTRRRPVRRIAIGTATLSLVGIGSLLALGASWAPNPAAANPSAMTRTSELTSGMGWVRLAGNRFSAIELEQSVDALSPGLFGGEPSQPAEPAPVPGAVCCVTSGGSCIVQGGSKCPSGSTQKPCPCLEPI